MYYLIGNPLAHSHSPFIHRAFGRYEYALHPLNADALGDFLLHGDYEGLNVTIPYKQAVIPYLDELSDAAKKIGSVNTVIRREGKLVGDNTDYLGMFAMAFSAGIQITGKKVVILGSGGTSLTARALAADLGAREIVVVSRSGDVTYADLDRHADADILINATPVGMYPKNGESPVSLAHFTRLSGVLDVIYNPRKTALLMQAESRRIKCAGGLYMLVAQAAVSCGLFTGDKPQRREIDRVYRALAREVSNITLIGMPGCGKSTVAAAIARKTGRRVIDTDALVAAHAGASPAEIIRREGEAAFRVLEHEAIVEAGRETGVIIAAGGGAVLDRANKAPLAQNGAILMIVRELSALAREGRPLSEDADLSALYRERLPKYLDFSDKSYENNGTVDDIADTIIRDYLTDAPSQG